MKITVSHLNQLPQAADALLKRYPLHRVFLFHGEMGVGKTTFIDLICKSLGVSEGTSSPTFSLVNEYQIAGGSIYHFDFYRIKDETEAMDIGYEDYFYSGFHCLVEWPEKIMSLWPKEALHIYMEADEFGLRHIVVNDAQ